MVSMLTLNVRLQTIWDRKNQFIHRKDRILRFFEKERPDVIGLQELMPPMQRALADAMPGYGFLGRSSRADGKGEYTAIAYRKDTLAVEEWDTFWLSAMPDRAGSRFLLQSPDARTCTHAVLRHREAGVRFRYFNTHLDHLSPYARKLGVLVILYRMASLQREEWLPVFWGGDFNFTPASTAYSLLRHSLYPLADLTEGLNSTFNWFGALKRPMKLDYILTDPWTAREGVSVRMVENGEDGLYLSDHNAILVDWRPRLPILPPPEAEDSRAAWKELPIPAM